MTDTLYFSRDTKVFLEVDSKIWEIPVLDGFSFSQATNASEITLNEMSDGSGVSRRGRQMFNDSYAPAEWSFSTYVRPFVSGGNADLNHADSSALTHAVEEALWAMMVGDADYQHPVEATGAVTGEAASFTGFTFGNAATGTTIAFTNSNKTTLGTGKLYFVLGAGKNNPNVYTIENCCVNEANIEFDIDGIATINWSGMGTIIDEDGNTAPTADITEGVSTTSNFIRNRLTSLTLTDDENTLLASGQTSGGGTYDITLTGGSITISNNMTFLTPETLGVVNQPLGHVTGTRSISGSFTCYLNNATDSSADLFERLIEDRDTITNNFNLVFNIGGTTANTPRLQLTCAQAHLEVPSHSIEDVISVETNFHALPSTIDGTDELSIKYFGTTL